MKKNYLYYGFFALILSSMIVYSGCGDDESDLVGTWELVSLTTSNCDDAEDNGSYDLSDEECFIEDGFEICLNGSFTFSDNGSFSFSFTFSGGGFQNTSTNTGTYTVSGNNIEICEDEECSDGSYTLSGDDLTLSYKDADDGCTYSVKLTKS